MVATAAGDGARRDPQFVAASHGSARPLPSGEIEDTKIFLRDYVNATVGFEELGRLTGKTPKSLMRMLSAAGNPTPENLFSVVSRLQEAEGVRLSVTAA